LRASKLLTFYIQDFQGHGTSRVRKYIISNTLWYILF